MYIKTEVDARYSHIYTHNAANYAAMLCTMETYFMDRVIVNNTADNVNHSNNTRY